MLGEESFPLQSDEAFSCFSVYHHISNKRSFLTELSEKKPVFVLMELATQDRYYPERKNYIAEIQYIKKALNMTVAKTLAVSEYSRPIVLFSSKDIAWTDQLVFFFYQCSFFLYRLFRRLGLSR